MIFSAVTIAVLASAMTALASPVQTVQKRQVGGVLICVGPQATGECTYQVYELGTCHDLESPWAGHTNTFAPDGEDFECHPRMTSCDEPSNCRSPTGCTFAIDFAYRHKYELGSVTWDKMKSFDCTLKRREQPTSSAVIDWTNPTIIPS